MRTSVTPLPVTPTTVTHQTVLQQTVQIATLILVLRGRVMPFTVLQGGHVLVVGTQQLVLHGTQVAAQMHVFLELSIALELIMAPLALATQR